MKIGEIIISILHVLYFIRLNIYFSFTPNMVNSFDNTAKVCAFLYPGVFVL